MVTVQMMTTLVQGYRNAKPHYVRAFAEYPDVLDKYGFNTTNRLAALIATAAAETGGFTITAENMNYTAQRIRAVWPSRPEAAKYAHNPEGLASSVYGSRMGNKAGTTDGWIYRGKGMNQCTGRDNYKAAALATGLPLLDYPDMLITDGKAALQVLCWEVAKWMKYCDMGEAGFRAVSNGINRGNPNAKADPIGWHDRKLWYTKVRRALVSAGHATPQLADQQHLAEGMHGPDVRKAQNALRAMGYGVTGEADGLYGPRTELAVFAFQKANGLPADGVLNLATEDKLYSTDAKPFPGGDAAAGTVETLTKAGDTTVKTGRGMSLMGRVMGIFTGVAVASEVSQSLTIAQQVQQAQEYKGLLEQIADLLRWGASNWHWAMLALVALGSVYLISAGSEVIRARIHSLRTGAHNE